MPSTQSSVSTNQQQQQQQQPAFVVQFVDSVTRCFNPYSERSGDSSTPVPLNEEAEPEHDRSRNRASTPSSQREQRQYDADRYIHRKLEIFRTTDEDCMAAFGIPRPRPSPTSTRYARQMTALRTMNASRAEGGERKLNMLVSSEEEEISNLAINQKRLADEERGRGGGIQRQEQSGNFIKSFFLILQDPLSCITNADKHYNYSGGGLCFANPVRMAETENVSKLSDWRLTAKEFVLKYHDGGVVDGCGRSNTAFANTADNDLPDIVASSASEEATMTSASYFDQKYSHIIEKNPPVPLFNENRVKVSESDVDGVCKILERRGKGEKRGGGGRRSNNESPQSTASSSTPIKIKVKKSSRTKMNHAEDDSVPIGESSSASSQSVDDEEPPTTSTRSKWQRTRNDCVQNQKQYRARTKCYEPDFVYSDDTLISHGF